MNVCALLDTVLFVAVLALSISPVFAPVHEVFPSAIRPQISHIVLCTLALILLLRYGASILPPRKRCAPSRAVAAGAALVAFGVLCLSSALMSVLSGGFFSPDISAPRELFLCVIAFLLSAFYEETVYRLYLPCALSKCFKRNMLRHWQIKGVNVSTVIAEAAAAIIFAFAHKYSGAPSVIKAFVAAIALRLCFKRSRSLAACVLVHTAYNTFQLLALIAIHSIK